jgi:hypothetical protein
MPPADDDYDAPAPKQSGGGGTAGLVLGIIGCVIGGLSLLLSFVPCVGALALWPGILGVILSGVGLAVAGKSKTLPIVALCISVASVGMALYQRQQIVDAAKDVEQGLKGLQQGMQKNADEMKRRMEEDMKKNMKGGN